MVFHEYSHIMTPDLAKAIVEDKNGTILTIEVTPGCRHVQFPAGYNPWRNTIGCHVTALPIEGRANKAVIDLVAEVFSVPRTSVAILSGAGVSIKRVHINGLTRDDAYRTLQNMIA